MHNRCDVSSVYSGNQQKLTLIQTFIYKRHTVQCDRDQLMGSMFSVQKPLSLAENAIFSPFHGIIITQCTPHATSFNFWCHLSTAFTHCPLIWHSVRPNQHLYNGIFVQNCEHQTNWTQFDHPFCEWMCGGIVCGFFRRFCDFFFNRNTFIHHLSTNTRIGNSSF